MKEKTPNELAEEEFVENALKRFKTARDHQSKWRQEAREDYDFYSGDQWDEQDKAILRDQLRPEITFNRVGPVIDSVVGAEISNRQEVRFIPREIGDAGVNELLTAAAHWVRDNCDAEDEESDAFMDAVVSGIGVTETRMNFDVNPEGDVEIVRVDPFEMYWDPAARKKNLSDSRFLFRVREMNRDEFEEMFPGRYDELGWDDPNIEDRETAQPDIVDPGDDYRAPDSVKPKRSIKVLEYQWRQRETYYRVADQGRIAEFPQDKFDRLSKRIPDLKSVKLNRFGYFRAYISGATLLEKGEAPYKKGFNYKFITAKRERNTGLWYGLVRSMKDPQRWANKWLSQTLHVINSNAKGGILAESDAFQNPRKAEEDWANPDAITWLRPGGLAKIQQKEAITYPSGLDKLMGFAVTSIRDVSGVNVEVMGLADRDQPGMVEDARKQSAFMILGGLFDSLKRYRKEQGRVLLAFIRDYISDGRLIRVDGENARYIPLVRSQGSEEFDIIVDQAPSSPNQKETIWAALTQLMPSLMRANLPAEVWGELVRYSPLPLSVAGKIASAITKPNPAVEQARQMEQQKLQIELQKLGLESQKIEADTRKANAQVVEAQAGIEASRVDMAKTVAEVHKIEAQAQNEQLDFFLKQREAELDIVRDSHNAAMEEWRLSLETSRQEQDHLRDMIQAAQTQQKQTNEELQKRISAPKRVKVIRGEDGSIQGAEVG